MLIYIPEPIKEEIRNRRYWRMLWVRIFLSLGLLAATSFALLLTGEYVYLFFKAFPTNGIIGKEVFHDHVARVELLKGALETSVTLSWIIGAIWFTTAYYNTKLLTGTTKYPVWASFSHVLPGFNFVHPQLIMREIILKAKGTSMSAKEQFVFYLWWLSLPIIITMIVFSIVFSMIVNDASSIIAQFPQGGIYFGTFTFLLTSFFLFNTINRYQERAAGALTQQMQEQQMQEQQMREQQMRSRDNGY